jgi:hypothetical protein
MFRKTLMVLLLLTTAANARDFCHRADEAQLGTHSCYTNVDKDSVHSPAPAQAPPPGATAQCRDNDWSFSRHHSGTCSSHGGVKTWLR